MTGERDTARMRDKDRGEREKETECFGQRLHGHVSFVNKKGIMQTCQSTWTFSKENTDRSSYFARLHIINPPAVFCLLPLLCYPIRSRSGQDLGVNPCVNCLLSKTRRTEVHKRRDPLYSLCLYSCHPFGPRSRIHKQTHTPFPVPFPSFSSLSSLRSLLSPARDAPTPDTIILPLLFPVSVSACSEN